MEIPVQYISDELDDPGLLEAVVEAPTNQAFMKQMSKQPRSGTTDGNATSNR